MPKVRKIESLPEFPSIEGYEGKKRVVIYARVSTGKEEQQNSLESQKTYYTEFINKRLNWKLVGTYIDDGKTGTSYIKRDAFVRMMADCEEGKVDIIVTKSVSRFARNTVDALKNIRRLKELGVEIYFEKENIWTFDGKGEFLLTLMTSFAQEESRSISENTAWGKRKRFADGFYSVAYSSFLGYEQGFVINEKEAITIRKIFKLYLMGYSCYKISNLLTADTDVTATKLEQWRADSVSRILQNEKYKGDALLQKSYKADFLEKKCRKNCGELPQYYVTGGHEPIIEPILFDYVQSRIKEKSILGENSSGDSIFSSKFICGKCGCLYGPKPEHSNDKYKKVVWMCRNRFKKGIYCKNERVDERELKQIYSCIAKKCVKRRGVVNLCSNLLRMFALPMIGTTDIEAMTGQISSVEDIAIIIKKITVYPDRRLVAELIDGSHVTLKRKGKNTLFE